MENLSNSDHKKFIKQYIKHVESDSHTERNLGANIKVLIYFSRHLKDADIINPTKEQILDFLNSKLKTKEKDPEQKSLRTWNDYRNRLAGVYRWYENKDIHEKDDWITPPIWTKIKIKKTKKETPYTPNDVWDEQELVTFVKYVPRLRDKLIYTLCWDLAGRNHEITKLKIQDIIIHDNYAVASIPYDTKTGTRTDPIILAFPYLKEWIRSGHIAPHLKKSFLITHISKNICLTPDTLWGIFTRNYKYVKEMYEQNKIDPDDLEHIESVLAKPKNPYLVGRHSSITARTDILTDQQLKSYAGWSPISNRIKVYAHRSPKQVINPLLEQAGIVQKEKPKPTRKECYNCKYVNMPESTICGNCNMVLNPEQSIGDFKEFLSPTLAEKLLGKTMRPIISPTTPNEDKIIDAVFKKVINHYKPKNQQFK